MRSETCSGLGLEKTEIEKMLWYSSGSGPSSARLSIPGRPRHDIPASRALNCPARQERQQFDSQPSHHEGLAAGCQLQISAMRRAEIQELLTCWYRGLARPWLEHPSRISILGFSGSRTLDSAKCDAQAVTLVSLVAFSFERHGAGNARAQVDTDVLGHGVESSESIRKRGTRGSTWHSYSTSIPRFISHGNLLCTRGRTEKSIKPLIRQPPLLFPHKPPTSPAQSCPHHPSRPSQPD